MDKLQHLLAGDIRDASPEAFGLYGRWLALACRLGITFAGLCAFSEVYTVQRALPEDLRHCYDGRPAAFRNVFAPLYGPSGFARIVSGLKSRKLVVSKGRMCRVPEQVVQDLAPCDADLAELVGWQGRIMRSLPGTAGPNPGRNDGRRDAMRALLAGDIRDRPVGDLDGCGRWLALACRMGLTFSEFCVLADIYTVQIRNGLGPGHILWFVDRFGGIVCSGRNILYIAESLESKGVITKWRARGGRGYTTCMVSDTVILELQPHSSDIARNIEWQIRMDKQRQARAEAILAGALGGQA